MNPALLSHEWLVLLLGLALLLADLWLPASAKGKLGYAAAVGVGAILLYSLFAVHVAPAEVQYAFGKMYALDGLALFFKRFFLLAALIVLLMSVEFADRIQSGIAEYYALILFALAGMLFASSANDFSLLFVSLELITVTFYVLTSFQRAQLASLEAGGIRFAVTRPFHRRAGHHCAMVEPADRYLRRHHSLRQSLRHPATQPETFARLFEHCPRRLHVIGRGGDGC